MSEGNQQPLPFNQNESCMLLADSMSCQAQTMLAKKELQNNNFITNYQVNHPVCQRFHNLMDRNLESSLLYTEGTTLKKHCLPVGVLTMTHGVYTLDQSGPWVEQHTPIIAPIQERFDTWTRAKGAAPSKT